MGHRAAMAIEPSADVLDRIQDANDRDYAINNLELDSIRLREVQTALGRLDAGTFGTCSGCGETIGAKRLAAVP
jgi:DnaK suppressor protein